MPQLQEPKYSASGEIHRLRWSSLASVPILAVGGESKSAVCLFHRDTAALSAPLGNLRDPTIYRGFVRTIDQLVKTLGAEPALIAHDCHPLYLSSQYAKSTGLPTMAIQHHHAHLMSVAADCGMASPALGICCDGLGLGSDGSFWGCEVMSFNAYGFGRVASLQPFELIGGDQASLETWRPAAALLHQAFGSQWQAEFGSLAKNRSVRRPTGVELELADRLMERRISPMTSSLGRLFDGVSFILGIGDGEAREGRAARALEQAAIASDRPPYSYEIIKQEHLIRGCITPMIRELIDDRRRGVPVSTIAFRFHITIASMLADLAARAAETLRIDRVVLSGGCFLNERLRSGLVNALLEQSLDVALPRSIPWGDDGLALGQAVIAAARALHDADSHQQLKGGLAHVPCSTC